MKVLDDRLVPVVDDLEARFPQRDRHEISDLVAHVSEGFETARVQDYVAVLTKTICHDELRRRSQHS